MQYDDFSNFCTVLYFVCFIIYDCAVYVLHGNV